jgi:hypothetical protein
MNAGYKRNVESIDSVVLKEAERIVQVAEERNLILRLLGAIAFRIHCPKYGYLCEKMKRNITDIDFMGYGRQIAEIKKLFKDLGYTKSYDDVETILMGRLIYYSKHYANLRVDVFLDKLKMCHTINFDGRLELDNPTIPISDLLLEKMQIVQLTEKDIKDVMMLLREHEVDRVDNREVIDLRYICNLLKEDWGFYYTVVTNLGKVKGSLPQNEILSDEDRITIDSRINKLLEAIEQEPKSLKWKLRAKIGNRKKWYEDVEETTREKV